MKEEEKLSRYEQVVRGLVEPKGSEKGWKNIQTGQREHNLAVIDEEKRKEICRKGAEAVNRLHGKKKTAREALEGILTLKVTPEIIAGADLPEEIADRLKRSNPDATMYDLIQLVAAGRAVGGSIQAATYIRDTYGDKPVDRLEVSDNVTTDADRALMASIAERLEKAESVQIIDAGTPENAGDSDN